MMYIMDGYTVELDKITEYLLQVALDPDQDLSMRLSGIKALGEIGHPIVIEELKNICADSDQPSDIREAAMVAMGHATGAFIANMPQE